jgi:hypothetical protein
MERREHPRQPLRRPAKLRNPLNERYLPAESVDLSAGGALLRVSDPARLEAGQPVAVAVAGRADQPLLRRDEMHTGRVVRRLGHHGSQYVAVAFDQPARHLPAAG